MTWQLRVSYCRLMLLTIFTPTYNREHTLVRVYESLKRQTDKRFEWLIVDDGSTDDTINLVRSLMCKEKEFEINYIRQNHGGKHRAQNKAVDLAKGDIFITCDSNKYMADTAVEKILSIYKDVKDNNQFCGVGGYRADFSGDIYGGEMKLDGKPYVDCTNLERKRYQLMNDKATAFRTELVKKYKSPEFEGEYFVSESVWLTPMAAEGYLIRWFPEILIYGEYEKDGLTKQGANEYLGHYNNFYGHLCCVKESIKAKGINENIPDIYEIFEIGNKKNISDLQICKRLEVSLFLIKKLRLRQNIGKLKRMMHK